MSSSYNLNDMKYFNKTRLHDLNNIRWLLLTYTSNTSQHSCNPLKPRSLVSLEVLYIYMDYGIVLTLYIYLRGRKQMVSRSLYHDTKRKGNEIRS